MPFRTIPGTSDQYALLSYDKKGRERTDDTDGERGLLSAVILARAAVNPPSHVFLFSHGWKGDLDSAREQYDLWMKAMLDRTADRAAVSGTFNPLWIGLHWPSQPFGDEEFSGNDFDAAEGPSPAELKAIYADRLDLDGDAAALLDIVIAEHRKNAAATVLPTQARQAYASLADKVGYVSEGPTGPPDAEGAPFDPDRAFDKGNAASSGVDFGGGDILGGILGPLRQLSYWTMKKRARTIGESGMHAFMTALMNAVPNARVHLIGHSFGTIVVSGIVGGPKSAQPLPRPVDSVALLQGAVSLWAFGDSVNGEARNGYFNPWIRRTTAVRGPIIVSRSIHDRAVGLLYPLASAISLNDGAFDPDDEQLPLYGAIGKYGIRGLSGVEFIDMMDENGVYGFRPGKVYNLQASKYIAKGGGVSGAHSDIAGPEVAHALWQATLT